MVSIRRAKRSSAKPLIGLYAESGCGKTYSSLLLARGFVGPEGRIVMVETESGRGEAFVGDPLIGEYDVISLRDNFSPTEYGQAIDLAEKEGAAALIIDSASHEWEGAGGVLDMAATNQGNNMKGVRVWQQPKMDHAKKFMLRLLQTPIDLVLVCMRAKYPMTEEVVRGKKQWVRSETLSPKQSDDILYEMFVHGWIDADHKWHGTKYTTEDLRQVLLNGEMISIRTGEKLASWARPDPPTATDSAERIANRSTIARFLDPIESATDLKMLEQVGDWIKKENPAASMLGEIRTAFSAKRSTLEK